MKDIQINNDIQISQGDLVIADSTMQNQDLIIRTEKGEWKQNPLVGVGISLFLKSTNVAGLKKEINRQLKADGMTVNSIEVSNNIINVDAEY